MSFEIFYYTAFMWQLAPTPVLLPGKSKGWRSLQGCSPWGCWGSDMTERFYFHFLLSCIGEGNGNPLQGSCLENPMEEGSWWAAIYGVAESWTRLKWLSSSSAQFLTLTLLCSLCCSLLFFFGYISMNLPIAQDIRDFQRFVGWFIKLHSTVVLITTHFSSSRYFVISICFYS